MIIKKIFGTYEGKTVTLYVLSGKKITVGVTDLGATIQFISVKTAAGEQEVTLGFSSVEEMFASGTYAGATIGRTANRIKKSEFTLNGKTYHVSANEGANQCHGGVDGFDKRFFDVKEDGEKLRMTLFSPDGDQGFPGNLTLTVIYSLDNGLKIEYSATSDQDTIWCPTNHVYFNLDPEKGSIDEHVLSIFSDKFTPIDEELIPTGEMRSVVDTPFDFRFLKKIGKDIGKDDRQLKNGKGYDHNFILNGEKACVAGLEKSGIILSVYTDLPCLQFYSGNFLRGRGKDGREIAPRSAFALEPQFAPNAINTDGFEKPILKAGQTKSYYIRYTFDV